ncbi:MFS transporter [Arsenicitalea aurantiaca]|uniref:MFS transporter n=1 Tax=Arsenicitalea aurantiaca TaxID=1783274 RepID=A0A433X380_9HYPH|nr:MDR family MFS transporter [Arsenicitalea aurantiaca]RUT28518.1 MFS transporter [Arsenicitalea aurantiaca]
MSAPSVQETETVDQPVGLIIFAIAAVLLLAAIGQTIVSTALPVIVAELGGLDHLTWVITAYLLSATVVAPIYGKLGDLYGRKIVIQSAIVIFLLGSVLAGIAGNMTVLILARVIQGLGGGGLMVMALTVVADVLPARERGKIQGLFGGVFGLATIIGPLLGGFLVENLSWHWIFFVNLPLGVLALGVIAFALKPKGNRTERKVDYAGAALLTAMLSSAVLYTSLGGNTLPWGSAPMLALIAIAIASLFGFIAVERRAAEPILPLGLFFNNTFLITNTVGFIVGVAMFGAITFLPLYLQVVQGVSPTESGLYLLPMMAGLISTSTLAGVVMSRTGRYRLLPILSTGILAIGMLLLSTLGTETAMPMVALYMFVVGIGLGPVMSIGVTAVQNAVPGPQLGVATASVQMFRQIGGSIGVSAFGAVFSAGLANRLRAVLPGGGTSGFDAVSIAAMPEGVRDTVLAGFVASLQPVFLIAAGASVIACLLGFLIVEVPLATTLRQEPEAEFEAEEAATAGIVGGPITEGGSGRA